MQLFELFAQMTKVDEAKRLVYGRAVDETQDHAGEIFDYATSKPYFEKWRDDTLSASDGRSHGNLREMHGNIAAGKLVDMQFDDTARTIDVVAKIVDDGSWKKVLEGVFLGFSIGGNYAKRWDDPVVKSAGGTAAKRYTANPSELSLADRPCNKNAIFFDIQKADGLMEKVAFKNQPAAEISVDGTPEDADALAKLLSDNGLSIGDAVSELQKAIAARTDVKAKEGESKYGDVKFADEKNNKYPIDTEEHIRAAWSYIGKAKNAAKYSAADVKSIKSKIVSAWKAKIDKEGPPSAAKKSQAPDGMEKSLYGVSQLAYLIMSLQSLIQFGIEDYDGDDDEPVIEKLEAVSVTLAEIFKEYAIEEADELIGGESDSGESMQMAEMAIDLFKAGKRNSSADQTKLQTMHDHAVALGADCATVGKSDTPDELQKRADDLQKAVSDATEPLNKRIAELEALPAAPSGVLMSVGKGDESNDEIKKIAPVVDSNTGEVSEVATLIKASRGNMKTFY